MPDVVDAKTRSRMMAGIRSQDTRPEILVRRELHRRGFRYRLHATDMPGKPDIVLSRRKAVVFVHGCFWHGHDCHLFKWPSTRADWWRAKIERNREVDREAVAALRRQGWRVGVVWECALKGRARLGAESVGDQLATWLLSNVETTTIRGAE